MNYRELEQEVKRLEEQITELKSKILEGKAKLKSIPYRPYEVEVPEDIDDYVYINNVGNIFDLNTHTVVGFEKIYKRGLAFKTEEQAEKYDQERMLLFKLHKWAEEHNGGWIPDWKDCYDKFYITYHHGLDWFKICSNMRANAFNKLPYFKSEELAREFIEQFGDEIKEVLL